MFERFTDRARRVVVLANEEARLLGHNYIGTEHLLLGLLREEGVAARALAGLNVSAERAREAVERRVGSGSGPASKHIPFTPRAKTVLELSLREALQLGHNYIGSEHLLLAIVREGSGVAVTVLADLGAEPAAVRQAVIQLAPPASQTGPSTPGGEASSGATGAATDEAIGEERPRPPNCPWCLRSLEEWTASKVVTVSDDEAPSDEGRSVRVVYCSGCGRALGILPE